MSWGFRFLFVACSLTLFTFFTLCPAAAFPSSTTKEQKPPFSFPFEFSFSPWETPRFGGGCSVSGYRKTVDLRNLKDEIRQEIVLLAKAQLGKPYLLENPCPPDSFNCSVLVEWVMAHFGISIPAPSFTQWRIMQTVKWPRPNITEAEITALEKERKLLPGDVLFFVGSMGSQDNPGHVGIYSGGGLFVEAKGKEYGTVLSRLSQRNDFVGWGSVEQEVGQLALKRLKQGMEQGGLP